MSERQKIIVLGGKYHGKIVEHESHFALSVAQETSRGFQTVAYPIKQVGMFGKRLYIATVPDLHSPDGALMELLLKPEWFDHWKAAPEQ